MSNLADLEEKIVGLISNRGHIDDYLAQKGHKGRHTKAYFVELAKQYKNQSHEKFKSNEPEYDLEYSTVSAVCYLMTGLKDGSANKKDFEMSVIKFNDAQKAAIRIGMLPLALKLENISKKIDNYILNHLKTDYTQAFLSKERVNNAKGIFI